MLLHMELIEEVRSGLTMIRYLNSHPDLFEKPIEPFVIALCQTTGGILAEVTNLFMLATRDDVSSCITFFVAFHVLNAIDNIYGEAIGDFTLRIAVEHPL